MLVISPLLCGVNHTLSPVVLDTPREPVRIENGRFSIGGL
jgi:hypothetical protein